jgi:hypothetical protein
MGIREELGENLRNDCASFISGRRILTYVWVFIKYFEIKVERTTLTMLDYTPISI